MCEKGTSDWFEFCLGSRVDLEEGNSSTGTCSPHSSIEQEVSWGSWKTLKHHPLETESYLPYTEYKTPVNATWTLQSIPVLLTACRSGIRSGWSPNYRGWQGVHSEGLSLCPSFWGAAMWAWMRRQVIEDALAQLSQVIKEIMGRACSRVTSDGEVAVMVFRWPDKIMPCTWQVFYQAWQTRFAWQMDAQQNSRTSSSRTCQGGKQACDHYDRSWGECSAILIYYSSGSM